MPNVNLLPLNSKSHSLGSLPLAVPLPTHLCLLPGEATVTKGCRGRGRGNPHAIVEGIVPVAQCLLWVSLAVPLPTHLCLLPGKPPYPKGAEVEDGETPTQSLGLLPPTPKFFCASFLPCLCPPTCACSSRLLHARLLHVSRNRLTKLHLLTVAS